MIRKNNKRSKTKKNLWLDSAIFLLVLLVAAPQFTGFALHEWLGLTFAAAILTHILIHWKWVVNVIKRLFGKLPIETRVNLTVNLLMFIDVVLLIFSGISISETALPVLGISRLIDPFWVALHDLAVNIFLVLLGVHVAMHWRWILKGMKRYVWQRSSHSQSTIVAGGN